MEICEANVRAAVLEIRHRWLSRISAARFIIKLATQPKW